MISSAPSAPFILTLVGLILIVVSVITLFYLFWKLAESRGDAKGCRILLVVLLPVIPIAYFVWFYWISLRSNTLLSFLQGLVFSLFVLGIALRLEVTGDAVSQAAVSVPSFLTLVMMLATGMAMFQQGRLESITGPQQQLFSAGLYNFIGTAHIVAHRPVRSEDGDSAQITVIWSTTVEEDGVTKTCQSDIQTDCAQWDTSNDLFWRRRTSANQDDLARVDDHAAMAALDSKFSCDAGFLENIDGYGQDDWPTVYIVGNTYSCQAEWLTRTSAKSVVDGDEYARKIKAYGIASCALLLTSLLLMGCFLRCKPKNEREQELLPQEEQDEESRPSDLLTFHQHAGLSETQIL